MHFIHFLITDCNKLACESVCRRTCHERKERENNINKKRGERGKKKTLYTRAVPSPNAEVGIPREPPENPPPPPKAASRNRIGRVYYYSGGLIIRTCGRDRSLRAMVITGPGPGRRRSRAAAVSITVVGGMLRRDAIWRIYTRARAQGRKLSRSLMSRRIVGREYCIRLHIGTRIYFYHCNRNVGKPEKLGWWRDDVNPTRLSTIYIRRDWFLRVSSLPKRIRPVYRFSIDFTARLPRLQRVFRIWSREIRFKMSTGHVDHFIRSILPLARRIYIHLSSTSGPSNFFLCTIIYSLSVTKGKQ